MTHVTEAIYHEGVFKPLNPLQLPEQQRVRLIVEPLDAGSPEDRQRAFARLRADIDGSSFSYPGQLPPRAELHDRI